MPSTRRRSRQGGGITNRSQPHSPAAPFTSHSLGKLVIPTGGEKYLKGASSSRSGPSGHPETQTSPRRRQGSGSISRRSARSVLRSTRSSRSLPCLTGEEATYNHGGASKSSRSSSRRNFQGDHHKTMAKMFEGDDAEDIKRQIKIKAWEKKHRAQAIKDGRTAVRQLRDQLRGKGHNIATTFKALKKASQSDDCLIDVEEFSQAMKNHGFNLSPTEMANAFQHFDDDGSGEINYEEFVSKMQQSSPRHIHSHRRHKNQEAMDHQHRHRMHEGAIDVDGDGHIDDHEMRLASYLKGVKGRDLDNDGQVDAQETLMAKQKAGRRVLARNILHQFDGRLHLLSSNFKDRTAASVENIMVDTKHFSKMISRLRQKERIIKLKSSSQVINCMLPHGRSQVQQWSKDILQNRVKSRQKQAKRMLEEIRKVAKRRMDRARPYEAFMKEHLGYIKLSSHTR